MSGAFLPTVGRVVKGVRRLQVIGEDGDITSPLPDILVLVLADGFVVRIAVDQAEIHVEMLPEQSAVRPSFELEADESCVLASECQQGEHVDIPFVIRGVTEWWAGGRPRPHLVGVVIWRNPGDPALCLLTEGDDADIVPYERLRDLLRLMKRDYGALREVSY